jgi:hypothetical protein
MRKVAIAKRVCMMMLASFALITPTRGIAAAAQDLPDTYSMNLSASDLLDPATVSCRLNTYLHEIDEAGHAKEVRVIFPPDFGPFILEYWIPIFRARDFRVTIILAQEARDADIQSQERWIRYSLPQIYDILDGVALLNEPNDTTGWSPKEYAAWHRAIAQIVREVAPGIPILAPTLNKVSGWRGWDKATGLIYGADYDIRSANVTKWKKKDLKKLAKIVGQEPLWLTEAGWSEQITLRNLGVDVERSYVYVWNGMEFKKFVRRPGGQRPPC